MACQQRRAGQRDSSAIESISTASTSVTSQASSQYDDPHPPEVEAPVWLVEWYKQGESIPGIGDQFPDWREQLSFISMQVVFVVVVWLKINVIHALIFCSRWIC